MGFNASRRCSMHGNLGLVVLLFLSVGKCANAQEGEGQVGPADIDTAASVEVPQVLTDESV